METNLNHEILQQMSNLENAEIVREKIKNINEVNILNLIPKELHTKYQQLLVKYETDIETMDERINEIKGEIRSLAITSKQSVKGSTYRVMFHKGRTTWDTPGLLDYMVNRPETEAFRRVGNPYASLYRKKDRDNLLSNQIS